jgi:hypothetical protein
LYGSIDTTVDAFAAASAGLPPERDFTPFSEGSAEKHPAGVTNGSGSSFADTGTSGPFVFFVFRRFFCR